MQFCARKRLKNSKRSLKFKKLLALLRSNRILWPHYSLKEFVWSLKEFASCKASLYHDRCVYTPWLLEIHPRHLGRRWASYIPPPGIMQPLLNWQWMTLQKLMVYVVAGFVHRKTEAASADASSTMQRRAKDTRCSRIVPLRRLRSHINDGAGKLLICCWPGTLLCTDRFQCGSRCRVMKVAWCRRCVRTCCTARFHALVLPYLFTSHRCELA